MKMILPTIALLIAGTLAAQSANSSELRGTKVTQAEADLKAVNDYVYEEDTGLYIIRMAHQWSSQSPGYHDIIERFKDGRFEGRLSLESLMESAPELFEDVSKLSEIFGKAVGSDKVTEAYGSDKMKDGTINWAYYADLAQDALSVYGNTFYFDDHN